MDRSHAPVGKCGAGTSRAYRRRVRGSSVVGDFPANRGGSIRKSGGALSSSTPFNPLDKKNLGISVAQALLSREVVGLSALETFNGAGIYALYYSGTFAPYSKLSEHNKSDRFQMPIYVGKAENQKRKGGATSSTRSTVLFRRLREHAESIHQARKTLRLQDFHCRFLVVDDIWIPLGENLLIAIFSPIWNTLIDGFGNHDPGGGRYEGMRPRWDVLHPGRPWAERCKDRPETVSQIESDVQEFLRAIPAKPARFYAGKPLGIYDVDEDVG